MAVEIERKFLVNSLLWNQISLPQPKIIRQGYLFSNTEKAIRVRIANDKAFLTIKGAVSSTTRLEFEYEIPLSDAQQLLDQLSENEIAKKRYEIQIGNHCWEVDVFEKNNTGLIVAEIELSSEEESFEKPLWTTEEVTHDSRYLNTNLAINPYNSWNLI